MQYVVGDRPLLSVTFKEDGSAIDLSPSTDAHYKVYVRTSLNGETAVETLMSEAAIDGGNADAGIAVYRFPKPGVTVGATAGALDEEGVLEFEFYLEDSADAASLIYYTSQKFRRKVRAKVGKTAS